MKLEDHLWVGCFRKRNAFLFFRWLFSFSMKLTCFPFWCPGFSMPLVSLSSPICSCCPWWEMETLGNFSSNLSYLGLKPMLVDKWIESAVCEQSLLLTEVAPSVSLLAVTFGSLSSASPHYPQTAVSHCPPRILLNCHLFSLASTSKGIPGLL